MMTGPVQATSKDVALTTEAALQRFRPDPTTRERVLRADYVCFQNGATGKYRGANKAGHNIAALTSDSNVSKKIEVYTRAQFRRLPQPGEMSYDEVMRKWLEVTKITQTSVVFHYVQKELIQKPRGEGLSNPDVIVISGSDDNPDAVVSDSADNEGSRDNKVPRRPRGPFQHALDGAMARHDAENAAAADSENGEEVSDNAADAAMAKQDTQSLGGNNGADGDANPPSSQPDEEAAVDVTGDDNPPSSQNSEASADSPSSQVLGGNNAADGDADPPSSQLADEDVPGVGDTTVVQPPSSQISEVSADLPFSQVLETFFEGDRESSDNQDLFEADAALDLSSLNRNLTARQPKQDASEAKPKKKSRKKRKKKREGPRWSDGAGQPTASVPSVPRRLPVDNYLPNRTGSRSNNRRGSGRHHNRNRDRRRDRRPSERDRRPIDRQRDRRHSERDRRDSQRDRRDSQESPRKRARFTKRAR